MGSGKSRWGRQLAPRLGMEFVDLDDLIGEAEGRSISEIFAQDGEPYFRQVETRMLEEAASGEARLIALGGGTPCQGSNMEVIARSGLGIYLEVPSYVLFGRLRLAKAKRPLIAQKSDLELRDFIDELLGARRDYYEQAEMTLQPHRMTIAQMEKAIRAGW